MILNFASGLLLDIFASGLLLDEMLLVLLDEMIHSSLTSEVFASFSLVGLFAVSFAVAFASPVTASLGYSSPV